MKSLLNALKEGRLIEIPTKEKAKAPESLALLLEAVPGIGPAVDIVKGVMEREAEGGTALGKGIACPHVGVRHDGALLCAVGWSPAGIDYGAPDGKKVHVLIMYYVPDSQRAAFLKELSALARAIAGAEGPELFSQETDLRGVRNKLLNWVEFSGNGASPDDKARMIRLEQRQAASPPMRGARGSPVVVPFSFVRADDGKYLLLSQDPEFTARFEKSREMERLEGSDAPFEAGDYHVTIISSVYFARNRLLRECVAVKRG